MADAANPSFITENPAQAAETESETVNERLDLEYEAVMEGPRENASRLLSVADSLNERMRGLLEKEKEEFIAAYRAHTRKVQEDLAKLRQRVAEEEESLHRDEKVRRLQHERDTFRAQALALDAGNSQLSKDLETIRSKLEVLEDDRNFLVRQMKGHRKMQRSPRPENDATRPGSPKKQEQARHELLKTLGREAEETKQRQQQQLPPIGKSAQTEELAMENFEQRERASAKGIRRKLQGVKAALGIERRQLETMSREVGLVQARRESNWLEALLLDCVRTVGAEVAERRAAAEGGQKQTRLAAEEIGAATLVISDDNQLGAGAVESLAADAWGEAPLRLEIFTAVDRCSVLRQLVADPRVQSGLMKRRQETEQQTTYQLPSRGGSRDREERREGRPPSTGGDHGADGNAITGGSLGWDKRGIKPTRVSWIGSNN